MDNVTLSATNVISQAMEIVALYGAENVIATMEMLVAHGVSDTKILCVD